MDIEEVDARSASDDVLGQLPRARGRLPRGAEGPVAPESVEEVVAFHRHLPATQTSLPLARRRRHGALYVHGPTATFLELRVEPARRRRGLGTALLERALERCRELGVEALRGAALDRCGSCVRCAQPAQWTSNGSSQSLLDLRAAELPEPVPPDGFRLVTWLGRVPEEHLAAYVVARAAMDDAPAPEGMDFPTWTAEKVRASEESLERRGREMRLTVAMDDGGEIGSFTELRVSRGSTRGLHRRHRDGRRTARQGARAGGQARVAAAAPRRSSRGRGRNHVERRGERRDARGCNESIGFRPTVVETLAALDLGRSARTDRQAEVTCCGGSTKSQRARGGARLVGSAFEADPVPLEGTQRAHPQDGRRRPRSRGADARHDLVPLAHGGGAARPAGRRLDRVAALPDRRHPGRAAVP